MILYGLIGFFALAAIFYVSIDNRFKRIKVRINQSLSGIDVSLTKRYDVLTKLADTTSQFMAHEKDLLREIISLRQGLNHMTINEKESFGKEMDKLAGGIQVTLENYPDIKSSANVLELQEAIRETESDLYATRRMYNSNIAIYNEMVMVFPSSVIANSNGYTKAMFFEAKELKREDVKIHLVK